ncbi:hypothetical protein AMK59_6302 [Oryctes borbonicus]|uniref:F-box domain-containing protein n=1 Tax=Oryctes borbonicus TaxID=1629725 RepID=A0A0T6B022_9SCAR|nr:hypothetical protein AMK59_6302 [Oryctes borbonicus]
MLRMGNRDSALNLPQLNSDYDPENGLTLNGYHIPPEIIVEILQKLAPQYLLTARLVWKEWNELVIHVLYNNYNRKFEKQHTLETLPFDLCYFTQFSKRLNKNLLKNVNGQNGFKHWNIISNGGDGIVIESCPVGSDSLPSNVEEFNSHTSCFVTSYGLAHKVQEIAVSKDKYLSHIINKFKPDIYASEWVAARFDCGARYIMNIQIVCQGGRYITEKRITHEEEQWQGSKWSKKEIIIQEYPDDVDTIVFEHYGQDRQFWKGHYGMKMAGAVVKLLLDTVKL